MINVSELENVEGVIQKSLETMGDKVKSKLGCLQILRKWENFVGDDAAEIFPVELKNKTLTLYSANPLLNDKYKFLLPELIEKINGAFNDEVVTKIIFGKTFQAQTFNVKKTLPKDEPAEVDEEIILTDEEIADCRVKSKRIKSSDTRETTFNLLIAQKKADKWKIAHNWHKCALCENLCEPADELCNFCQVVEPQKMSKLIREIFIAKPYIEYKDVKKKVLAKMPHMKKFCKNDAIETARMDLIQQTASSLPYGEDDSPRAKFFVMLVNQLREEELTEKIIKQTLNDFSFDLAERPSIPIRNLKKFIRKKK